MVCSNKITNLLAISIQITCICQSLAVSGLFDDGSPAMRSQSKSHVVSGQGKKRKPNIIFILVDDLGFNDVGYHGEGGAAIRTPNIDRLAMEGVRLENYYVQPSCTPTRSQLMTGRYQIHTGMQHDNLLHTSPHCLPVHERTLAQALKTVGYSTHAVGKWHLGYCKQECLPTRRGFDSYLGMILGTGNHFDYKKRTASALYHNEVPVKLKSRKYSTILYTERAEEVIKFHAGPAKPPLFLYVSYQSQHTPLQVPSEYLLRYTHTIADTRRRIYAAMLSVVDEGVQNITRSLITNGLWENTLLIFSTDNGGRPRAGGINWPLRGEKSSLWEGGVRGVAFVTGPVLPKSVWGTVSTELCHVSDWYPTLVKGVAEERLSNLMPLDGVNLWRTISQGAASPRKELLHNIDPLQTPGRWTDTDERLWGRLDNLAFNATMRAAIRYRDWKLVTGSVGPSSWTPPPESTVGLQKTVESGRDQTCVRLFNIQKDPTERFNVAANRPRLVTRLLARLAVLQAGAVPVIDHTVTLKYPGRNTSKPQSVMPLLLVQATGVWGQWMDGSELSDLWTYH